MSQILESSFTRVVHVIDAAFGSVLTTKMHVKIEAKIEEFAECKIIVKSLSRQHGVCVCARACVYR